MWYILINEDEQELPYLIATTELYIIGLFSEKNLNDKLGGTLDIRTTDFMSSKAYSLILPNFQH